MSIPTFTQGYPPDGSSLGQTKSTIRDNLDGTFLTLAVDHINNNGQPGSKPAGYHKVIHMVPQGSNPGAVTGYGQLFSKTVNSFITDQALFWETGSGLVQQLTMNLTPSAAINGYTFIPGGLMLQWGKVVNPTSSGTVLFTTSNVDFPNNLFNVQLTMQQNSSSRTAVVDVSATFDKTQFSYLCSSSGVGGLFWFAIGN